MERSKKRLASVLIGTFGVTGALVGPAAAAAAAPVSSHDPALAAAVTSWFTSGGNARIAAIQSDFEKLAKAANATDMPGVKTGCAALVVDVAKAQRYDPLPDVEAQRHWGAALARYAQGAADCVKGAENVNGDLLNQANAEITQGSDELTKATARVENILN